MHMREEGEQEVEEEEEEEEAGCTMWSVNKDIISWVVAYVKQSLCKLTDFPSDYKFDMRVQSRQKVFCSVRADLINSGVELEFFFFYLETFN